MSINNRLINTGGAAVPTIPFSGGSISSATSTVIRTDYYGNNESRWRLSADGLVLTEPWFGYSQVRVYTQNTPYNVDAVNLFQGFFNYGASGQPGIQSAEYDRLNTKHFTGVVTPYSTPIRIGTIRFNATYQQGSTHLASFTLPAGNAVDFIFSQGGTMGYALSDTGNIYHYSSTQPYTYYNSVWSLLNTFTPPRSDFNNIYVSDDGAYFFGMTTGNILYQYSLPTPYNLQTTTLVGTLNLSVGNNGILGNINGITFPAIGGFFYVIDYRSSPYPRVHFRKFTF